MKVTYIWCKIYRYKIYFKWNVFIWWLSYQCDPVTMKKRNILKILTIAITPVSGLKSIVSIAWNTIYKHLFWNSGKSWKNYLEYPIGRQGDGKYEWLKDTENRKRNYHCLHCIIEIQDKGIEKEIIYRGNGWEFPRIDSWPESTDAGSTVYNN